MSGRGRFIRAMRFVREVGPAYAIAIHLRRIMPPRLLYYRHILVMRRDLKGCEEAPAPDSAVRWATEADAERIGDAMWDVPTVRRRMKEGERVAIVPSGGRVLSCIWFKTGTVDFDHWLTFVTPEDAYCTLMSFTRNEERGKGHNARIHGFTTPEFARAGFTRRFSFVDRLNQNSLKSAEKVGTRGIGEIVVICIATLMVVRVGRRWHFGRWRPQKRLRLDFEIFDDRSGRRQQPIGSVPPA